MFQEVMRYPEISAVLVERLLHIKVGHVEYPELEKAIKPFYTTKEKAEEYVKFTPALSYLTYYYNHFEKDAEQKNPPLTVSCKEMENFIVATCNKSEHLMFIDEKQCHFKGGEIVRVVEGPFKGVEGKVARVVGQQRVVVTLSRIGLVSTAYIPSAFIQVIGE